MKGVPRKARPGRPKKTPTEKVTSDAASSQAAEGLDDVSACDFAVVSQSAESSLQSTPKRGRRQTGHTQEASQSCSKTNGPPVKCRRGRPRKNKTEDTTIQTLKRSRPRFELERTDAAEQDVSLLSSDLSIELSHHEEQPPTLSPEEDGKSDADDEELPSFLMQVDKKPPSITEGQFVWVKYRNYPFWPALVKSVNRKQKKASILFIDDPKIHQKKGFTVAQKTLKPFDCEEASELVCKAKEEYDAAIDWSLDLIGDYRIRIACGSFSGSFIEYFAHDMSYPVRRTYPQAASERLTIASDAMTEAPCDDLKDDSFCEQQEEVSRSSKRLLPDRSHAAHNRANEKLVHFIVKQRMVEEHLLAVAQEESPAACLTILEKDTDEQLAPCMAASAISEQHNRNAVIRGQEQSRWLRSFLSANRRRVVNIYLEDDQQLDQVYLYLNELYATAVATATCLSEVKSMERVPFVLDVLLPEAIIHAIAGVNNVSVKKAEESYMKGRSISNRERQEFDQMIERQMRQKNTALALI